MFETKSLHSKNSYVGHLNLIHGSTQIKYVLELFLYLYFLFFDSNVDLFMYLIERNRFGTVRKINVSTGPQGAWPVQSFPHILEEECHKMKSFDKQNNFPLYTSYTLLYILLHLPCEIHLFSYEWP